MLRDPNSMSKAELVSEIIRLRPAATAAGTLLLGGTVYGLRRVPKELLEETRVAMEEEVATSDGRHGEDIWTVLAVEADEAPVPNEPFYAVRFSCDSEVGVTVHVVYVARKIARGGSGDVRYEAPAV